VGDLHVVGASAVVRGSRGMAAVDLVLALVLSWLVVFSALGVSMAVRGGVLARRLHSVVSAASAQAESQAYLERCPSVTPVQTGDQAAGLCYSETVTSRPTAQGPIDLRVKVMVHDGVPYSILSSAAACTMGTTRSHLRLYWATSGGAVAADRARVFWDEYTNRRLRQIDWWSSSGTVYLWYDSTGVPPGTVVTFTQPVPSAHARFQFYFWPGFGAGQDVTFDITLFRQSAQAEPVRSVCTVRFQ
jgi:hypothetical protein